MSINPPIIALCLGCLSLASVAPAHAKRVALVIGNAQYQNEKPLRNPINDAELIANVLEKDLKFDEVLRKKNLNRRDLNRALAELVEKAKGADAVVVYYSGHGMQRGGQNYLIPVDAVIQQESDIDSEGFASAKLLADLETAKPNVTVVVLDACRDNPYSVGKKSGAKGLARIGSDMRGMLVAYATIDGQTAYDGDGGNSPYALALARQMKRIDQPVRLAFEEVADEVMIATKNKQRPVTYGDLKSTVYLSPFSPVNLMEQQAWELCKGGLTRKPCDGYLAQYPQGRYAALANSRLADLEEAARQRIPVVVDNGAQTGKVFRDCPECPEMVWLPPGRFMMGSNEYTDEKPVHEVNIGYPLAVGKYEVTFAEWDACVAGGGCKGYRPDDKGWGRGRQPVINVSWDDGHEYVKWLSAKSGKGYRLLSEAEWEYAARAGTTTRYYWGDTASHEKANYGADTCCKGAKSGRDQWEFTAPVGSFDSNGFGLHDMLGNASEWVEDCYHDSYKGAPSDGSVVKVGKCDGRVLRGGSWSNNPVYLRAADRNYGTAANRNFIVGLRVARTLP